MNRLSLLNSISKLIDAKDYLEIGVAEGNTLTRVVAPHRVGVDPAPRYHAMDDDRLRELKQVEIHESESDHFFYHNTRTFDLAFVDGLHLYEQAIKDILNALSALNPGGFVVVHDLIPLEPDHAARERVTSDWNGDVWKVVFDIWKHHPNIGYFVVDSDAGMGVMWKKDESDNFEPGWKPEILDLDYSVMEQLGDTFLNRTKPDPEIVTKLIEQALKERTPLPHKGIDRKNRAVIADQESFAALVDDNTKQDGVWDIERDVYVPIDETKFHSNYPVELFKKTVCAETGGNIHTPQQRVYVLNDALVSPCVKHNGKWPYLWHIRDQHGNDLTDLPQRRDPAHTEAYSFSDPVKLEGLYLYMGWFSPYFGHYFTEMLPQLKHLEIMQGRPIKLLYNAEPGDKRTWETGNSKFKQIMQKVFDRFGVSLEDMVFVEQDVQVEKLIAPTPINRYRRGARKELLDMAREVRQLVVGENTPPPSGIYLSRTRFNGRRLINGDQIEQLFKTRGFQVVHPETLPLEEQIRLAAGADVIAGEEGSALCTAIFAENPVILELETGRFHSNIARISYMNARDYAYIVPYTALESIPPVGNQSLTYAHPWVVDQALTALLGGSPATEALCGPREMADLMQHAALCSLKGDIQGMVETVTTIINNHANHFRIEWVNHLFANIGQFEMSAEMQATCSQLASRLIDAYRARMISSGANATAQLQTAPTPA